MAGKNKFRGYSIAFSNGKTEIVISQLTDGTMKVAGKNSTPEQIEILINTVKQLQHGQR